ncbi:MAG: glutathione binding-like protein [Pseudomonadota bacterium]
MSDRAFVAGERFTIADITAMVAVDFMKPARLALADHHGHVQRWYESVKSRPSARA